jgi:hypothetical protein
MTRPLTVLLESSRTPIYQRIVGNFRNALAEAGHRVLQVNPDDFGSDDAFLAHVNNQPADYYLVTNPVVRIEKFIEPADCFAFELIDIPLIFIHHDSCFFHLRDPDRIRRLIEAYCATGERSFHFFLERAHMLDLRALGVERVHKIPHASEFAACGDPGRYERDVCFVGHVLPGLDAEIGKLPWSERLIADFWRRVAALDYCITPSASAVADGLDLPEPVDINRAAVKSFYITLMHLHSHHFRGEIVRKVSADLAIIGGDPAYMGGRPVSSPDQIRLPNIRYFPPTPDYAATRDVYARSRINLNVTSLQFDQAVINRVIDAGAAGAFVLTDWKDDLAGLTTVAEQIAYRTVEELNDKISYYLDPANAHRRLEIADTLRADLQRSCTYPLVVESILSKVA